MAQRHSGYGRCHELVKMLHLFGNVNLPLDVTLHAKFSASWSFFMRLYASHYSWLHMVLYLASDPDLSFSSIGYLQLGPLHLLLDYSLFAVAHSCFFCHFSYHNLDYVCILCTSSRQTHVLLFTLCGCTVHL